MPEPSPAEYWNPKLVAPWPQAYGVVEVAARALLSEHPAYNWQELSTNELVEALYPEAQARGPGIESRKRLYKALQVLASNGRLTDCCHKGQPKRVMGREIRPWRWHAPIVKTCPHCGGVLT